LATSSHLRSCNQAHGCGTWSEASSMSLAVSILLTEGSEPVTASLLVSCNEAVTD
jgi:hypothetical protein